MKPRVSTILNTLADKPAWLKEAIDSVLQQEEVEVQLIVSTVVGDASIEVAQNLGLEVLVNDHAGIYYQLNNALSLVTGDWFVIAGGNDVLLPTKYIDEVSLCMRARKKVCYSDFHQCTSDLETRIFCPRQEYSYLKHMTVGNIVPDIAMMHREIIDKYQPFRGGKFGNLAYYDFWLRVAEGEGEDVFIRNPHAEWLYRFAKDSSRHLPRRRNRARQKAHILDIARLQAYHRSLR